MKEIIRKQKLESENNLEEFLVFSFHFVYILYTFFYISLTILSPSYISHFSCISLHLYANTKVTLTKRDGYQMGPWCLNI